MVLQNTGQIVVSLRKQPGKEIWMVGNAIAAAIVFSMLVFFVFVFNFGGPPNTSDFVPLFIFTVMPISLAGAVLGFPQAMMMFGSIRQRLQWIGVTMAGCLAGGLYFVFSYNSVDRVPIGILNIALSNGVVFGLTIGVAQWLILCRIPEIKAYHWLWGNVAVWVVCLVCMSGLVFFLGWGSLLVASILYAAALYGIRCLAVQKGPQLMHLRENPQYGSWFLANFLSMILPASLLILGQFVSFWFDPYRNPAWIDFFFYPAWSDFLVVGALMGVALGSLQGIVLLRRWRDRLLWLLATMVGASVVWTLLYPGFQFLGFDFYFPFGGWINLGGVFLGPVISGLQWLILRRCTESGAVHWIWGSAVAWGTAYFFMMFFLSSRFWLSSTIWPFDIWFAVLTASTLYALILLPIRDLISWRGE